MHGRARETREQTAERRAASAQKVRSASVEAQGMMIEPCASFWIGGHADSLLTSKQVAMYRQLQTEVIRRRNARVYDSASMDLAGKLLELNPEACRAALRRAFI